MSTGTYFDQTQAIMYLKRVVKSLSCACDLTLLNVLCVWAPARAIARLS